MVRAVRGQLPAKRSPSRDMSIKAIVESPGLYCISWIRAVMSVPKAYVATGRRGHVASRSPTPSLLYATSTLPEGSYAPRPFSARSDRFVPRRNTAVTTSYLRLKFAPTVHGLENLILTRIIGCFCAHISKAHHVTTQGIA